MHGHKRRSGREIHVSIVSADVCVLPSVPLGRIGRPDDIAGATLYLCSRAGAYVTGAIVPIDGGQSVQHGMTLFKE